MHHEELLIVPLLIIGLSWLVLHYMMRWKTAATLTSDDEHLLDELYRLARRLDERMDTVERLVAADHPEFEPRPLPGQDGDDQTLSELDRLLGRKGDRL